MRRNNLIILIILFLIFRIFILFFSIDAIYHNKNDEIFYHDEMYRGTIGREIIRGKALPLFNYLDADTLLYDGGTIINIFLNVIVFLLFGQTYFSLKVALLIFSLATLIIFYLFLKKFFNHRIAFIASLLFIFSPPLYTQASLVSWGVHIYSTFFVILAMFIFYSIFFVPKNFNNYKYFFFLGLTCGFSIWVIYTSLIFVINLLIFWIIFDRKSIFRKPFFIFIVGLCLGYLPGFYCWYLHLINHQVAEVPGYLSMSNFNEVLSKAFYFIKHDFPYSLFLNSPDNILNKVFSYFYYFIFAIMYYLLVSPLFFNRNNYFKLSDKKWLPLLVYPLLFYFLYSVSGFILLPLYDWYKVRPMSYFLAYRYFAHLLPFVFIIIALGLDRIWSKKHRLIALSISILLIMISVWGNVSMLSLKITGNISANDGFSYYEYGLRLGRRFQNKENFKKIKISDEQYSQEFYQGFAKSALR